MLTFFRRLRKGLLDGGKTRRYLVYAIGEIALVVIGILIALQINNWNEWRKDRDREFKLLQEVYSELTANLNELKDGIENNQLGVDATIRVREHIYSMKQESENFYIDLYTLLPFDYFYPRTTTYEFLKTSDIEIIRNDSLRRMISHVYDMSFVRLKEKEKTIKNPENLLIEYYKENFKLEEVPNSKKLDWWLRVKAIPNDSESLLSDPEFKTITLLALKGRENLLNNYNDIDKRVRALVDYISIIIEKDL